MPDEAVAPDNSATQTVESPAAASPEAAPAPEATPEAKPEGDPRGYTENPLLKVISDEGAGKETEGDKPTLEGEEPQPKPEEGGDKPEFLLDKFKTIEEQARAYAENEKLMGKQGSELAELRRQNQEFMNLVNYLQNQGKEPGQSTEGTPKEEPKTLEEQLQSQFADMSEDDAQKFMDEFYQNPGLALSKMFAPMLKQAVEGISNDLSSKVEPLIQKEQFNERVAQNEAALEAFREAHEDFDTVKPYIEKYLEDNPEMVSILDALPPEVAIPMAYQIGKGMSVESVQKAPTLEEQLADPEVQKTIASNEAIRNLVLTNHAQDIKDGKPPVVIASQPGGTPPATPKVEIKSAKDAGKALLAKFGIG